MARREAVSFARRGHIGSVALCRIMSDIPENGIWEDPSLLEVCGPKIAKLFGYWDGRRGDRAMPSRREIDPLEMRDWLGNLVLYDVLRDPLDFRYRLVGSHVAELLGEDLTGRRVSERSTTDNPAIVLRALSELVERRTFRFRRDPAVGFNGRLLARDRIYLPLSADGEQVDMILLYFERLERAG